MSPPHFLLDARRYWWSFKRNAVKSESRNVTRPGPEIAER